MPRVGRLVLLASAAAAIAAVMSPVAAQSLTCSSVPASALSFTCGTACTTSQACVGGGSASACKCLTVSARKVSDDDNALRLLIPFGKYVSDESTAAQATASEVITGTNDTKTYASASNDVLNRVEKLSLPSNTSIVIIRGGSSLGGLTKHTVANVSFDPQFLTAATKQVKFLMLENLALGTSIDKMVGNFPLAVYQLMLRNNLIKKFPQNLQNLGALLYLHLSYNDIETIEKDDRMTDLLTLYLRNNKIKTFNALFPKLTTLDLTFNKLEGVPDVIAQHTNLKLLYLGGADNTIRTFNEKHAIPGLETLSIFDANLEAFDATLPNLKSLHLGDNNLKEIPPKIFKMSKLESLNLLYNKRMLNVSLTNTQANFIYNLKNFSIDATSLRTDCDASQKYTFTKLNVTTCLSEPKNVAVIESPRIVVADDKKSGSGSGSANAASSSKKSSSNTGIIIGCIAGAVVVIAIIAAFVIRKKKSNQAKAADALTGMTGTVTGTMTGTNGTSLWIDQDLLSLKVSSDDVQDVKKIGNGAFADVWLVKFRGSELMASKRLRESGVSRPQVQSFIDEIKLVSTLKHPCIVELKGVAWVRESDLQALFEYMDSGDLRDYLVDAQGPAKWNAEKLQIAIDVAEALVYVHSFMPPLVHRDLKSRNVLLSSNNGVVRAKLTDFGVSRFRSEDNTMTSGVGTGRWLAPEVISGDGNYGPPADIFSFGALLYELDTHQIPYSDVRGANGNKIADVALLQLVATGELVPAMSASCPTKIAELANRCFALSPSARPAAPEIAYALRTLQKNMKF